MAEGNAAKTKTRMKSALRKGAKGPIKVFNHELVVTVKARATYKRKKNQVRHNVYAAISNILKLIRDNLMEGKVGIAILGKEGRRSTKPPIRTPANFPKTTMAFKRDYASLPNPCISKDGKRANSKNMKMCLVLGMDVKIAQVLKAEYEK